MRHGMHTELWKARKERVKSGPRKILERSAELDSSGQRGLHCFNETRRSLRCYPSKEGYGRDTGSSFCPGAGRSAELLPSKSLPASSLLQPVSRLALFTSCSPLELEHLGER